MPRRSAASTEHSSTRRALLDGVVRVQPLRVREADHAVVGRRRHELLGGERLLDPGVRVRRRHLAEAGPQAARAGPPTRRAVAPAAARSADSNIGYTCTGMTTPRASSSGWTIWRRSRSLAEGLRRRRVLGLDGPVGPAAGGLGRRARAPRLGPADEDDVDVAGGDVEARAVDERLRRVAAGRRVDRVAHVVGADPLGDEPAGVALAPRQQAHDPHRVERRRAPCRVGGAGVVGGPPGRLGDEVDRLERRRRPRRRGSTAGRRRRGPGCGGRGARPDARAPLDRPVKWRVASLRWRHRRPPASSSLCTANQCRSPMAEALLRHRLEAGRRRRRRRLGRAHGRRRRRLGSGGRRARRPGHRPRRPREPHDGRRRVAAADLVIGMERRHVQEAIVAGARGRARVVHPRDLVRRAELAPPRRRTRPLRARGRRAVGRAGSRADLLGVGDDAVDDPIGRSHGHYERTAAELDDLLDRLVDARLRPRRAEVARDARSPSAPTTPASS